MQLRIKTVLKIAERRAWVLPKFQREFSWDAKKIVNLFDSIDRGCPIGEIVLLRYHKDFHFEARGIDGDEKLKRKLPEHCIIGGQQRFTSLYKVIKDLSGLNVGLDESEPQYISIPEMGMNYDKKTDYAFFLDLSLEFGKTRIIEQKRPIPSHISFDEQAKMKRVPLEFVFCHDETSEAFLTKYGFSKNDIKAVKAFKKKVEDYEITIKRCVAH